MKKTAIRNRFFSAFLAGLMLFTTPMGIMAESPPPAGNLPIVIEGEESSEPGQSAGSSEDFVSSDKSSSEMEESSDPVSSENDTSSEASKGELPSSDTAYGTSSDAVVGSIGEEWGVGKAHPFPGTVILVDENGNLLPMPRTRPQIIEGLQWENPNGRSPYLFVTFNGKTAYCVEPAVFETSSKVDYVQKTDWFGDLDDDQRKAISYLIKFGSPKGNDAAYNDWHVATQCLIWEVADGVRKPDMTISGSSIYYNALIKVYPGMTAKYNQMIDKVKSWKQIPSFANPTKGAAPTYKMEGTGPYSVTLTNTNAACQFSVYDFKADGISVTKSGSSVTFTSPTEITSEIMVTGNRTDTTNGNGNFIFWYDPKGKDQTRMQEGPDPVPCYFKLGTENSGGGDDSSDKPPEGEYSITIRKFETGTNIPLDGAQFHIQYLGTNGDIVVPPPPAPEPSPDEGISTLAEGDDTRVEIPEYETTVTITSGGKITIKVPYRGIYKVTEVSPPENHLIDKIPSQTLTCTDAAPDATIDFHNDAYTSIRVKKVDKATGQPLANATIQIEKVDGSVKASKQTGADGIALFSDLQPGAYRITELQAPEGYELTTEVITRDIQSNRVEEVILNNQAKAGFRIRKVAAESGQGLQGAVFELWHKDGAFINSYITDRNGLITVEKLPEGWYTVIEKQPPEGYLLDPDHVSQDVHLTGTEQDVIFRDPKKPSLKIEKIDANTGRKLAGAVFTIREKDGAESFEVTTGPDGTIQKDDLKPTWYVITEIKAPNGYVIDSTPIIKQLEAGKTTEVVVVNGQKPTLTIRKVDKDSGDGIQGVTLRIAKNGSQEYKDVITENGGYVILKDMEPGHYTVTEIACPSEYILDPTPHNIEIVVGKPAVLTITNTAKPSLKIQKLDEETRQPLPGAVFNIQVKNGKDLGNFTTDANGQILLAGCDTGLYVIREVSAPNGYLTDTTPVEALVEAGKIKTITLYNTPEHPLLIKKVDAKTGLPLTDATFLVTKINGEFAGEYTTGRNGYATVTGLQPGYFQVREIKAPDGYLLNDSIQTVELKQDEPAIVVFEDQPMAGLRLAKVDSKTKKPLVGAKFRITQKGGAFVGDFVTDEAGEIELDDLAPGWYTCVELEAPEGYLLDANPKDIELKWGELARLTFDNTAFSGLQVLKKDTVTGEPMAGVTLRVSKQDGTLVGEYQTERGGYFTVSNLEPGYYTIREIRTLDGYLLDETPQTIEVKKGEVATATFYNYPTNSLQVRKLDAKTKLPLAGVTFKVMTFGGELIDYYTTNADGYFVAAGLEPGNYIVVETATVEGYLLNTDPVNVTLEAGKTKTIEITNQPLTGLQVMKRDAVSQEPMAGVTLRISRIDGTLIGDYKTEKGGYFVVPNLDPGWYTVREVKTLPGYVLDETVQTVEIKASGNAFVEFYNYPENSLQVKKIDAISKLPLAGIKFKLTTIDGEFIGNYTTNADGYFVATGLKPGRYTLIETETLPNYQLDTSPHNITLESGKTATIEITNQPLASLQVRKLDAVTNEPIDGVTFEVKTMEGAFVGEYTTEQGGYFTVNNLAEGWYTVREIRTKPGFLLNETPQNVQLSYGKTAVLTFFNYPLNSLTVKKIDALTKEPLVGVKFRLETMNGDFVGEYQTQTGGYFVVTDLTPGWYRVFEIATLPGYRLDPTPKEIQLVSGKSAQVEFENSPLNNLQIKKIDAVTRKPMVGVRMQLEHMNGQKVGEYVTQEGGLISVRNLEPGWYTVFELETLPGYALDDTPQNVEIVDGQNAELTFVNAPLNSLQVRKTDAATGEPLEGVRFKLTTLTGDYVGEYMTGPGGYFVASNLKEGWYTCVETATLPGYILDKKPQNVQIKAGGTAILEFTNMPLNCLQIRKTDGVTNKPLEGIKFRIAKLTGEVIGDYKTNAAGLITVPELKPGWYSVWELETLAGYILDSTPQNIKIEANKEAVLEFVNLPQSDLLVQKVDSITREPLANAKFRLTTLKGELVGDYTTNASGWFTVPTLTPGWYLIQELSAPEGYLLDSTAHRIEIVEGKPAVLELTNQKLNTLQIRKIDAVTKLPLAGVKFRVATQEGEVLCDLETDSNGMCMAPDLKPGWYKAWETETIPGYILDPNPKSVKLEANKTAELEFTNQPLSNLLVRKLDSVTKKPLEGVRFRLTTMTGDFVGDYTTDSNGWFNVNELTPGWYLLTETATIPGYLLDTSVQRIQIQEGKPTVVEFTNQPLNTLQVRKVDSVTGKPIQGVRFRLARMDGQQVGDYTTDAAGNFSATDLEPGWYTCWELSTIPGYILDTTPQNVQLVTGKMATLEFQNVPLTGLQIRKADSVTGAPLAGAEFRVEEPDGKMVGSFISDSNGIIYIPNLREGVLIITETKAPNGYKIDSTPRRVEIRADQLNVVEYRNQPWPVLAIRKVDAETGKSLAGVRIRLFDAYSRELGTYTTNSLGKITLTGIEAGSYSVQEVSTIPGYVLDSSIRDVTLEWGKTTTVEITNKPLSTLRVKKIDSETGKPIYGVTFLLYDLKNNVLGEYTTNQSGIIEFPRELAAGRYRLKEIKTADGYVLDDRLIDITLKAGETTEIVVKNTPNRGQIQIEKKSAEYNDITKLKKGASLSGAVFEIFDRTNTVVDRITTDKRGIATSKLLPLGVYGIREITAPDGYQLNDTVFFAEIKLHNDLIQFEVLDENEDLEVTVQKYGNIEAMPGDVIQYDFKHISNASSVELEDYYFHDKFPTDAIRLEKIVTGTWSEKLTYEVLYKTNMRDYRTLADDLDSKVNHTLDCTREALSLRAGEYITDIKFEFGTVQAGFEEVKSPVFYCTVQADLPNEYRFTNCADVGGKRGDEWILAKDCWTTIVYGKPKGKLPKTGL